MTDVNSLKSVLKFLHTPAKSYDDVEYEPTFKASSMFPIMCGNGMSATITFMNYWKFKNEIESISCVATVRSAEGETLKRVYFPVDQPVHSLKFPELASDFLSGDGSFVGSCEVEFFAVEDLKFPYPAVSIFYETAKGVSAVHTASRVFHSIGDMDAMRRQWASGGGGGGGGARGGGDGEGGGGGRGGGGGSGDGTAHSIARRLPRLVGIDSALEIITTGRHLPADEALSFGVVDEVVPPGDDAGAAVFAAAMAMASDLVGIEPAELDGRKISRMPPPDADRAVLVEEIVEGG